MIHHKTLITTKNYPTSSSSLNNKQHNSMLGREFKPSRDFPYGINTKPEILMRTESHNKLIKTDSVKLIDQYQKSHRFGEIHAKYYQTEKEIKSYRPSDFKTDFIYETSRTLKDIENIEPRLRAPSISQRQNNRRQARGSLFIRENGKLNGDWFEMIKQVGSGKYGKVFLVRDKITGFVLALKAIEKKIIIESNLLDQFIREIKIQFFLNHPNIIKLYGFFDDAVNFYLLMELGCDGQLYDQISDRRLFSEESCSYIARTLLKVAEYMHKEKVIHRDIKPENIVSVLGNLKICDFGWAVYNNTEMRSTFCGTPLYFSPELLSGKEYDEKIDLWAIGILIFELMLGKSPFNLQRPQDLSRIITHEIEFPKNIKIGSDAKYFLRYALEKNPLNRATSNQLLETTFIEKFISTEVCEELCWGDRSGKTNKTKDKSSHVLNR